MYNAQIKKLIVFCRRATIGLFLIGVSLTSCNKKTEISPAEAAGQLVREIDEQLHQGNYKEAIRLIDSLNTTYPNQIKERRTTLLSRAQAMQGLIRDSIPVVDGIIVSTRLAIDSLKHGFTAVAQPGFSPYLIDSSLRGTSIRSGSAIIPRLESSDSDSWSIIISLKGTSGITGINLSSSDHQESLIAPGKAIETTKGDGYEALSLNTEEAQRIARALQGGNDQVSLIVQRGDGSTTNLTVNPVVAKAILRTARYSQAIKNNREALKERELLERKLIVAQNQIANFQP